MIFCTSALILFGRDVDEFQSFSRTYITVFRGILGDFDYGSVTKVGRLSASVWWAALMLLVNLVMVNMVLAIIMDVYSSVKARMGENTHGSKIYSEIFQTFENGRLPSLLNVTQHM